MSSENEKNFVTSPLNTALLLTILAHGADGSTAEQIRTSLNYKEESNFNEKSYREFLDSYAVCFFQKYITIHGQKDEFPGHSTFWPSVVFYFSLSPAQYV